MIANVELVSGSDSGLVAAFPLLILAIGALGIAFALGLRARRPAVYARIGRAFEEIA